MDTLIDEEEIRELIYEDYQTPDPLTQMRMSITTPQRVALLAMLKGAAYHLRGGGLQMHQCTFDSTFKKGLAFLRGHEVMMTDKGLSLALHGATYDLSVA